MTHLNVINRALILLGETPLSVMTGTDDTTAAVTAFYEAAWDEVLRESAWRDLLVISVYTGTELSTAIRGKSYSFDIDDDEMVHITEIVNAYGKVITEPIQIGRLLYSMFEELTITYVSNYGILPVSSYTMTIDPVMPQKIVECVALRLAANIAMMVTNNPDMQITMQNRYSIALQNAMDKESAPIPGEALWGSDMYSEEDVWGW